VSRGYIGILYGDPLYVDDGCLVITQIRFPRSKKKRIRKKWSKSPNNFRYEPGMCKAPYGIIVHPALYEHMKESLANTDTTQL
jgi:hypothetical protein